MSKMIKLLSDRIEDELNDARFYAEQALLYKDSEPDLARTFSNLSASEMEHMDMLHKEVVKQIEAYRRTNGEPPVAMKAVYDYLHKRFMEKAAEITNLQSMYKR